VINYHRAIEYLLYVIRFIIKTDCVQECDITFKKVYGVEAKREINKYMYYIYMCVCETLSSTNTINGNNVRDNGKHKDTIIFISRQFFNVC